MNIGIFSGSFNPIHNGHTQLAEYIRKQCQLDEVWLMVTPNNPLKTKSELWDENIRLELADIATKDFPFLKVSDFEFHLPRPSYTVDTLRQLNSQYPQHRFSLIIGSDNLTIFHKWKEYEYILQHYHIIVYPRQGDNIQALRKQYPQITILDNCPLLPISSTIIRQHLQAGLPIDEYVNEEVARRINNELCKLN